MLRSNYKYFETMNLTNKFFNIKLLTKIIIILLAISLKVIGQTTDIYVAKNGDDLNTGTKEKPLKTIEAALKIKSDKNRIIYLRKGYYQIENTINVSSNTTIASYNNEYVQISGGKVLDVNKFVVITDTLQSSRINKKSYGKIYKTNLKNHGVINWGELKQTGYDANKQPAPLELFYNKKPLTIARWPNDSLVSIGKVIEKGATRTNKSNRELPIFHYTFNKPLSWSKAPDIWIAGQFAVGWAYDNLSVEKIDTISKAIYTNNNASYGIYSSDDSSDGNIKAARNVRGFYFYNILEELDQPGEWYLDRSSGDLYLWPETSIKNAIIEVSTLDNNLIILKNASNVKIKNISFCTNQNTFVKITNSNKITFEGCSFINSGLLAIEATKSKNVKIINSVIGHTGSGGISIEGGDRKTLDPSNNVIQNCEFYDYSRIYKTYTPAITLAGVGNIVKNCYIHDTPDQAIIFSGNDHIITNNKIETVCYGFSDMGAIYTGRDPSSTGSSITNNLFKNIYNEHSNMIAAVYMDDGSGGINVTNNLFDNCGSKYESGFGGVHINGGANNLLKNNIFINCQIAYSNSPWSDKKWNDMYLKNPYYIKQLTETVDIRSQKYIMKYPYLKNFFDSTSIHSRKNIIENTMCYNVKKITTGSGYQVANTYQSNNSNHKLPLKSTKQSNMLQIPEEVKRWPGWKPIDYNNIGLKK